jgi:hypothetical protein
MNPSDLIDQFVEDLDSDALENWAAILNVPYSPPAADDDWPDWGDELRTNIAEAMKKVGK